MKRNRLVGCGREMRSNSWKRSEFQETNWKWNWASGTGFSRDLKIPFSRTSESNGKSEVVFWNKLFWTNNWGSRVVEFIISVSFPPQEFSCISLFIYRFCRLWQGSHRDLQRFRSASRRGAQHRWYSSSNPSMFLIQCSFEVPFECFNMVAGIDQTRYQICADAWKRQECSDLGENFFPIPLLVSDCS